MLFLEGVTSGDIAKGLLMFDVPKAKPNHAVLSDGFFGGDEAVIAVR